MAARRTSDETKAAQKAYDDWKKTAVATNELGISLTLDLLKANLENCISMVEQLSAEGKTVMTWPAGEIVPTSGTQVNGKLALSVADLMQFGANLNRVAEEVDQVEQSLQYAWTGVRGED